MEDQFETLESAYDFVALLGETVAEAKRELEGDVQRESASDHSRRLDALRVALYSLDKLELHVNRSQRILNDLRTLRRLLFEERGRISAAQALTAQYASRAAQLAPDSLGNNGQSGASSEFPRSLTRRGRYSMSDNLVDSAARLERLVARTMKETDPVKYDELGTEIWRALSERLMKQESPPVKQSGESDHKNVA
jgi:hypothetical protein